MVGEVFWQSRAEAYKRLFIGLFDMGDFKSIICVRLCTGFEKRESPSRLHDVGTKYLMRTRGVG
jgi:hypothetical protein